MREINLSIAPGGLKPNTSGSGNGWWWVIGIAGLIFIIYMVLKALKKMGAKEDQIISKKNKDHE